VTGKPEVTAKIRQSSELPTNQALLNASPFLDTYPGIGPEMSMSALACKHQRK
jgi:hypothetical protein